jgi:hypothetical protein
MKGRKKGSFERLFLIIVLLLLTISLTQNAVGEQIDVNSHDPLPYNSYITVTFLCDFDGNNCEGGSAARYGTTRGYIHTGLDLWNEVVDESFENWVVATLPGKVAGVRSTLNCNTNTTRDCPASGNFVILEHLLVDGSKIYSNYGHLLHLENNIQAAGLDVDDYVVSGSFLGYKGSTGNSSGPHLHFEISNQDHFSPIAECALHWIPACENKIRYQPATDSHTVQDPAPFRNHDKSVLLPFLSRFSENVDETNYDVFGLANQIIYGYLPVSGCFNHAGILAKNSETRADAENPDASADHDFLAEWLIDCVDGFGDNYSSYQKGEYLFLAYIAAGPENALEYRYGYPIKFQFLENDRSVISDNDQRNVGSYQFNQNFGSSENKIIPGYYISAQIVRGSSNAWAQWKPNVAGAYKLSVHIPEQAPETDMSDGVIYRIKVDGTDANQIVSSPVNHINNRGSWVEITSSNGNNIFYFTTDGYVELLLGADQNDISSNPHIDNLTWVSFDAIKFEYVGTFTSNIDCVLMIDSSGSMGWNDPNDFRKEAAKIFVDTARNDDQIAIVDFDGDAKLNWPLWPLTESRLGIKSAINLIDSAGGTNISAAMQLAYDQLILSSQPYKKAAVLLTDGEGTYNNEALLYQNKGWPVYTVGLGFDPNPTLLKQIANQTGGEYFALTDPNQLKNVYFEIATQISGGSSLLSTNFALTTGQSNSNPVNIPPNQQSTTFLINWPGSDVSTTLISPGGREIHPDLSAPDVYHAKGLTYELYRITNPEAGTWEIICLGVDLPPGGETVNVSVSTIGPPAPQDSTPPVISIRNPLDGKTYFDQLPTAFRWTVEDSESAVTNKAALLNGNPINNGDSIRLTQLGENTLTITATNELNLSNEVSITFYVNGFRWLPPIKYKKASFVDTKMRIVKKKSTIPIKFRTLDAVGDFVIDESVKVIVEGTTAQFVKGKTNKGIRINHKDKEPKYIVNLHTNFKKWDYGLEEGNVYCITVYFDDILAGKTRIKIK